MNHPCLADDTKGTQSYKAYMDWLRQYLTANQNFPRSLFIEVTPYCNLRCVFCACFVKGEEVPRFRKNKFLSLAQFKQIVNGIQGKFNCQMCFTYSGEPLLNPETPDMVSHLCRVGIPSKIYTNAMLLTPELSEKLIRAGLNRLIVSFDGATKKTYESIRVGANFDTVVQNIRSLIAARDRLHATQPFIEMQFIMTSTNHQETNRFRKLARDIGVDNAYTKSLYIYSNTQNQEYIDFVKGFYLEGESARYTKDAKNQMQLVNAGKCPELQSCVITVDGDILMCCFDLKGEYCFGNAIASPLHEIWVDERYVRFRERTMARRKLELCRNCISSTPIKNNL